LSETVKVQNFYERAHFKKSLANEKFSEFIALTDKSVNHMQYFTIDNAVSVL